MTVYTKKGNIPTLFNTLTNIKENQDSTSSNQTDPDLNLCILL